MTISSLAAWECNAPSTFPSLLEFIHRSKIRSVEDPICHYLWTCPYHGVGRESLFFRGCDLEVRPMSTEIVPKPNEVNLKELFARFVLAFWPVSLIAALLEFLFYGGDSGITINLGIASLAGLIAVLKHLLALRRKNAAM